MILSSRYRKAPAKRSSSSSESFSLVVKTHRCSGMNGSWQREENTLSNQLSYNGFKTNIKKNMRSAVFLIDTALRLPD